MLILLRVRTCHVPKEAHPRLSGIRRETGEQPVVCLTVTLVMCLVYTGFTEWPRVQGVNSPVARAMASTPPGTHPPIFWLGGRQREYPPILLRTFGYSRPILVALCSLSLKPISFGYKTPPIRFSQAGGQSAHKARPPNLELALTPLRKRPSD